MAWDEWDVEFLATKLGGNVFDVVVGGLKEWGVAAGSRRGGSMSAPGERHNVRVLRVDERVSVCIA